MEKKGSFTQERKGEIALKKRKIFQHPFSFTFCALLRRQFLYFFLLFVMSSRSSTFSFPFLHLFSSPHVHRLFSFSSTHESSSSMISNFATWIFISVALWDFSKVSKIYIFNVQLELIAWIIFVRIQKQNFLCHKNKKETKLSMRNSQYSTRWIRSTEVEVFKRLCAHILRWIRRWWMNPRINDVENSSIKKYTLSTSTKFGEWDGKFARTWRTFNVSVLYFITKMKKVRHHKRWRWWNCTRKTFVSDTSRMLELEQMQILQFFFHLEFLCEFK